ncbi:MAG: hypothetical protein JNL08_07155 [Planctomycetes bacterium]|nr:hypothetical protein [Planctomycetota bacterium]
MPFLLTLLLVLAVHLPTAWAAWTQVGLLADDRHMVGAAVLRHRGQWSFGSMWVPEGAAGADAATALYRPFVDLGFWLEAPWFGTTAFGYHVTNSVLHCATALVWFVLVRRRSGSIAAGLACALLFAGWPSHGEATHWIAARTNVQSTFLFSAALLVFDAALARRAGALRRVGIAAAALLATAAVGTKESAVFVLPLAACLAWQHSAGGSWRARAGAAAVAVAPVVGAVLAWLAWRTHLLGTWGSGTHYGWLAARIGPRVCLDWLELLFAPRHRSYTAAPWTPVLWLLHGALLAAVVRAAFAPAARGIAALGATLLVCGFLAGIGLETMDPATLENARYAYEPVLGLCVLAGIAIAALPTRARGASLAVLVLVHAIVLDGNRTSWLRAAAVYQRLEHDTFEIARATQQPIRVLQAPGVYEGAFALLNGYTETLFLTETAPPGTNLRGQVSSAQEWRATLQELAVAAAARRAPTNTFTVRWDDGALAPFELDARWPQGGIGYAWIARERPFVGSTAPVHVLWLGGPAVTLAVVAHRGERTWRSADVAVAASGEPQAVELVLPLPGDLDADVPVPVELHVRSGDAVSVMPLGVTVPSRRW